MGGEPVFPVLLWGSGVPARAARQRLGEEQIVALLQESLSVAHRTGAIDTKDLDGIVERAFSYSASLCAPCALAEGKVVAARIANHVEPHHDYPIKFWSIRTAADELTDPDIQAVRCSGLLRTMRNCRGELKCGCATSLRDHNQPVFLGRVLINSRSFGNRWFIFWQSVPPTCPWRKENSKWHMPHRKFSVLLLFFAVIWRLEAVP
jgi:hypothetical protein